MTAPSTASVPSRKRPISRAMGRRRDLMVAGDHNGADAGTDALRHRRLGFLTGRVHHGDEAEEGQAVFIRQSDGRAVHAAAGEGQHPQALIGKLFVDLSILARSSGVTTQRSSSTSVAPLVTSIRPPASLWTVDIIFRSESKGISVDGASGSGRDPRQSRWSPPAAPAPFPWGRRFPYPR